MKKEILLPTVAWVGGIAGFALRWWELASAYDPQLRLIGDTPATGLLWGLSAALLLFFAVSCRKMGKQSRTVQQWLYAPMTGYLVLMVCAGFVLMASALVGIWLQNQMYHKDGMLTLTYTLCLLGGACLLMVGARVYQGRWSKHTPLLFMGPSFCTLVWLVVSYQANARQPETELFAWQMLSGVAVVMAMYSVVTLAIGKGDIRRTCVFSLMGISLSLIALADGPRISFVMIYLSALLCLTAQSWMLLRGAFGEPWPEGMPDGVGESGQDNEE